MSGFFNVLGAIEDFFMGKNSCTITLSCMGDRVAFPVTPASFEVNTSYNNDELNISELGAISMRGKRGLTILKFSSFFPVRQSIFDQGNEPYNYIEKLKSFAESIEPCHLTISSTRISLYVTIESLSYSEKDGTGDVYFDISLKEYRYLLKDSGESNSITGLTSRIATTPTMTSLTINSILDTMDIATKLSSKIVPIHYQDEQIEKVYNVLAKMPPRNKGDRLSLTKNSLHLEGKIYEL